jgi:hypothetical protein
MGIPKDEQQLINDMTGQVPSLLNAVLRDRVSANFDVPELQAIASRIDAFVDDIWEQAGSNVHSWLRSVANFHALSS